MSLSLATLRLARIAAAVVAVLSLLTLALLALLAETGEIELSDGAARRSAPASASPPAPPPPPPERPEPPPPPAADTTRSAALALPAAEPSPTTVPAGDEPPRRGDQNPGAPDEPALEPCALGLPPPERTGGLASLTPLIPAFGPFAAEAFAFSPAYEPMVELFGPFLPILAEQLADNEAAVTTVIALLRQLEQVGFEQLQPLYGPYRQDFLDAASALAEAMAPYAEQLRGSPAAACLIALEGLVADNAG